MRLAVLLCLGASVGLSASPAVPEATQKVVVTDAQVTDWVQLWQKRLHLENWKIESRIVRSSDLKPDTLGNLKWNSITHSAAIKVLNPVDYDIPAENIPEDMEYTVLHELIHLQLSALPRDANRKDIEEQVVNRIADALMQLERGDTFHARSVPVMPYRAKPANAQPAPDVAGRDSAPKPVSAVAP
jgi:hypothetical protein